MEFASKWVMRAMWRLMFVEKIQIQAYTESTQSH